MTREEVVELADAVAGERRHRLRHRHEASYGAQLVVLADSSDEAVQLATAEFVRRRRNGRTCRPGRSFERRGIERSRGPMSDDLDGGRGRPARLAGRVTRSRVRDSFPGWTPPAVPAVYAIAVKPEPDSKPEHVRRHLRRPLRRPLGRAVSVQPPAGVELGASSGQPVEAVHLHLQDYGGLPSHREQIARENMAIYRPSCNPEQYDSSWKDEWIGEYTAPTTGPLTTSRDPDSDSYRAVGE